ncbi:hypothetical protein P154DRAFT_586440 [Amniculicola lignicola CBS 123094]|uniref:Uncharacterized protein n=1 Tax=Amniculicola lignicola CBS 123094 TaxID=1392246 RepID=A0A6A5WSV8_9PLEO|nr:hypothetical protein P154DRAFT_586440 [Amniculicola lignicola CBS 123094]
MKSFVLATALFSAPLAYALPGVVAKPLPKGCSSYPGYDKNSDIAGPWTLKSTNTDNPTIENHGNTAVFSLSYNSPIDQYPTLRRGYITFSVKDNQALTPLQCSNGTLNVRGATTYNQDHFATDYVWTPLTLSPAKYDAGLMWKVPDGEPVKLFEHYFTNGTKQNGYFLGGYENSTTWGFTYLPRDQGSSGWDYFYIRLLGPNSADPVTGSALGANETKGFVRIYNF